MGIYRELRGSWDGETSSLYIILEVVGKSAVGVPWGSMQDITKQETETP
ncbi:hypothetical protein QG37_00919 [Candidozyma auris]|nr:hypothetical protein QG37_00919 [[Candida] auris]